jgi:hypothetical protein
LNNFHGYSYFKDVQDLKLRDWNRYNVFLNIKEKHGNKLSDEYISKLERKELVRLTKLAWKINSVGYEQYRRDLMRGNNL